MSEMVSPCQITYCLNLLASSPVIEKPNLNDWLFNHLKPKECCKWIPRPNSSGDIMFLQQVVTMLCLMLVFLIADEIKISSNTLKLSGNQAYISFRRKLLWVRVVVTSWHLSKFNFNLVPLTTLIIHFCVSLISPLMSSFTFLNFSLIKHCAVFRKLISSFPEQLPVMIRWSPYLFFRSITIWALAYTFLLVFSPILAANSGTLWDSDSFSSQSQAALNALTKS